MQQLYDCGTRSMTRSARWTVLCLASTIAYRPPEVATASGCPAKFPDSEDRRIAEFERIYGSWPPSITLPGKQKQRETTGWRAYHEKKEARLMDIEDMQWRWERWLEQVQIRNTVNYTETGWALGEMPRHVHNEVLNHFRVAHQEGAGGYDEGAVAGYITGRRNMVSMSPVHRLVTNELQKLVGEWSGLGVDGIEPTSTYGIRVYYKNSTLATHVDRIESHILSVVYCVDAKYSDPHAPVWKMEADPDLTGQHATVEVKPGQIFYYESAKLAHGRPTVLQGDYSAHIFVHYRPVGWNYQNVDRVYGVPPGWADERLPDRPAPTKEELR